MRIRTAAEEKSPVAMSWTISSKTTKAILSKIDAKLGRNHSQNREAGRRSESGRVEITLELGCELLFRPLELVLDCLGSVRLRFPLELCRISEDLPSRLGVV